MSLQGPHGVAHTTVGGCVDRYLDDLPLTMGQRLGRRLSQGRCCRKARRMRWPVLDRRWCVRLKTFTLALKATRIVEPVFWLLHGMVDKLWWDWQMFNPSKNLLAFGGSRGRASANLTFTVRHANSGASSSMLTRVVAGLRDANRQPWSCGDCERCNEYDERVPVLRIRVKVDLEINMLPFSLSRKC
jgi:hypothetical protein